MNDNTHEIFNLRITLLGVKPRVWRDIKVSADCTLKTLHSIISGAFDWNRYDGLHTFALRASKARDDRYYGNIQRHPYDVTDETGVRLADILTSHKHHLTYGLDQHLQWICEIQWNKATAAINDPVRAARCFDGAGYAPPIDIQTPMEYSIYLSEQRRRHNIGNDTNRAAVEPLNLVDINKSIARSIKLNGASREENPSRHKDQSSDQEATIHMSQYEISWDPVYEGSPPETPELAKRYNDLHPTRGTLGDKALETLEGIHLQYPDDAKVSNFLSALYEQLGRRKDAFAIMEESFHRHPDYLFAKVNWIRVLIFQDKLDEAEKILNRQFELGAMFPNRKCFHITEFSAFYKMICIYHIARHNIPAAESALKIMQKIIPDDEVTQTVREQIQLTKAIFGFKDRVIKRSRKSGRSALAKPAKRADAPPDMTLFKKHTR